MILITLIDTKVLNQILNKDQDKGLYHEKDKAQLGLCELYTYCILQHVRSRIGMTME